MPGYIAHLKSLSKEQLDSEIDGKIADSYHELVNSEGASSAIAVTNAFGWGCDEYEVISIELTDDECLVEISWHASGDQDGDKPFCGDTISGTAQAVIDDDEKVSYRDIDAETDPYE